MRQTFRKADFRALEATWNTFYPPRYRVDAEAIERHTIGCPLFDWGASMIDSVENRALAFVAIKRSATPKCFAGMDPDQAHLSAVAYLDPADGVDLFAEVKRTLKNRGFTKIVVGQDIDHFFSGCPDDCCNLKSFLMIEGFEEGGENVDLERDLGDYTPPAGSLDPLGAWPGNPSTAKEKPYVAEMKPDDREALLTFLKREFPGRWTHDTMSKLEREACTDFVYLLWVEGKVEGFASTQNWTHVGPSCGAVWHLDLGEHWGALGPIGVSASVRGRGLGNALLGAALQGLHLRGVRRTIIDWTGLVDFYGGHGFEVARRHRSYELAL